MNTIEKNTICLKNIDKTYHNKKVLDSVSLTLQPGTTFGLIGLNGAGKTTLIRILLGLINADSGICNVLDMNPADHGKQFYRRIGVVLEHNGFFGNLTVQENLRFFSEARGISYNHMNEYFQRHWKQSSIGSDTRKIKYYSRGQKMQCSLCRAFLGWPEIFLLDEPVVALDIQAYDHFCNLVHEAHSQNATIIISSHQLDAIDELCNSIGILENGTLKVLDIKSLKQKKTRKTWLIKSNYRSEYQQIIETISGESVTYEGGTWIFPVSHDKSEAVISAIITQLAAKGCTIYEVRPEKEDFRKSIQYHIKVNE